MIIKKLSIYNFKEKQLLKSYPFNDFGLIIIRGIKKNENEEGNGVGKSALINSINYLLGESIPKEFKDKDSLLEKDVFFTLELFHLNKKILLGRSVNEKENGFYLENKEFSFNIEDWERKEEEKYKDLIQQIVLGNNSKDISYPSIREFISRDEKTGFNDIDLPKRKATKIYKNLSYLFSLPTVEENVDKIKEEIRKLKNELSLIKKMSKDISQIRMKEKKLSLYNDTLNQQLDNLKFSDSMNIQHENYNTLKSELNKIHRKIFEVESLKTATIKNINNLKNKDNMVTNLMETRDFFDDILSEFPKDLKKNYIEVENFHKFLIENRGSYFNEKLNEINLQLNTLNAEKKKIQIKLNGTSKLFCSTDILKDIKILFEEIKSNMTELAEYRYKIELYNKKNLIETDITAKNQEFLALLQKTNEEFDSSHKYRMEISDIFDNLTLKAYKENGDLNFEFDNSTALNKTSGRVKITCTIDDETSHGRLYMKINMFDLTWFLKRVYLKKPIELLIHDGSYAKPNNLDAKYNLLSYVHSELVKEKRGQYFVTLNTNELSNEQFDNLINEKSSIIDLNRDNGYVNRFLGFKY